MRALRPHSKVKSNSALIRKRAGQSQGISRLVFTDQEKRQRQSIARGKSATHSSSKVRARGQGDQPKSAKTHARAAEHSDTSGKAQSSGLKTLSGDKTSVKSGAPTGHQIPPRRRKSPKSSSPPKARYVGLELVTKGLFFPPGARVRLRPMVRPRSLRKHLRYVIKPKRAGYIRGNTLRISRTINADQVKVRACVRSVCSRYLTIRMASADAPE